MTINSLSRQNQLQYGFLLSVFSRTSTRERFPNIKCSFCTNGLYAGAAVNGWSLLSSIFMGHAPCWHVKRVTQRTIQADKNGIIRTRYVGPPALVARFPKTDKMHLLPDPLPLVPMESESKRSIVSNHTDEFILIQMRTNRYRPIRTDTDQFIPIHMKTNTYKPIQTIQAIHTNTYENKQIQTNSNRYRPIHTNTHENKQIQTNSNNTSNINQFKQYIRIKAQFTCKLGRRPLRS